MPEAERERNIFAALLQWRFGLKSVLLVENIHIQRLQDLAQICQ